MTETYIHIEDLRIKAYHGVMPQEHIVGNDYGITIKVGYPWHEAMDSDDVDDTLNYAMLADTIKREMLMESQLLEHVAGRVVKAIRTEFPMVTSISLKILKLRPPMPHDCKAGVSIEWKK